MVGNPIKTEFEACFLCLADMANGYDKLVSRLDELEQIVARLSR